MKKKGKATVAVMESSAERMRPGDPVELRWLVSRDLPAVADIESGCYGFDRWTREDYTRFLRTRNVIGMAAVRHDQVVGFMIYTLDKDSVRLRRISVDPHAQRKSVGSAMIDKLKSKLSLRRRAIVAEVPEQNLAMHLFLRKNQFLAKAVLREEYPVKYRFVYQL